MVRGSSTPTYCLVSTHTTLEDAILALHAHDAFEYVTAYNYGAFGNGRVYRCISHEDCERRLRILESTKDEEEIPVTFQLAAAGEHGDQVTNRKRNKYADQPEMLVKVPDEGQVRNRLLTLRKHNRKSPGATTTALSLRGRKRRAEWDESSESEMEVENSAVEESTRSKRHEEIATVESDIEEEERFDKEKLTKEFAALPGRPVFWSILKKTKYIKDKSEDVVTEWMTGQVIGWQTKGNSSTKWVVRYTDGEIRLLELEELVDEIRSAAKLGLNVTDRPLDL
ncbi:hypothetical protein PI124_g17820 [Phytophthora idaei]|nr:hypothetical protein PI125_g18471 [Phytophthora idaei]KAG3138133.1 hypothetical protein PI126_g17055 [Phytophthora idaei]KAG3237187.1 hypothetical protein PI124_g17820 [Phytophthora idaei]